MSTRPILFSGPMVRAILAGQKTVTRRVVTPQPPPGCDRVTFMPLSTETSWHDDSAGTKFPPPKKRDGDVWTRCPYGMPGDTLWVRETWASPSKHIVAYDADATCGAYLSDGGGGFAWMPHGYIVESERERGHHDRIGRRFGLKAYGGRWRPSVHMPRWASRLTLRVIGVRVERLHAIDEADAILEGVDAVSVADVPRNAVFSRRDDFVQLWEKINSKRAPWASNPWVWRVAFDVAEAQP